MSGVILIKYFFFHQQASTNVLAKYDMGGVEYKTNPIQSTNNVIGENKIVQQQKWLAELFGFDNFARCTNHGNQALLITLLANLNLHLGTIMNHIQQNNMKSQIPYVCKSEGIEHTLQNALIANIPVKNNPSIVSPAIAVTNNLITVNVQQEVSFACSASVIFFCEVLPRLYRIPCH